MTRKEALKILKYNSKVIHQTINGETDPNEVEALEMAIKALEQEPCEDAISRQAVINAIANTCFWLSSDNWEELIKCINSIPPVNPQPKAGHWINIDDIESGCSECGHREPNERFIFDDINFCAKCGAKMVEPQERVDKE